MRRLFQIPRDWSFLISYVAIIFFIFPFLGYHLKSLIKTIPQFASLISFLVYAIIVVVAISIIIYVLVTEKRFKLLRLLIFFAILTTALYILKNIEGPYDKFHIIEYSILSFFLFRVLRFYNTTTSLYLWCIVFIGIAGLGDECVQAFIPSRSFDLQDLRVDISSGILSQLIIAFVICPRLEKWRIKISLFQKKLYKRQAWIKKHKSASQ